MVFSVVFFRNNCICVFWAVLGPHCWLSFSVAVENWGCSLVVVRGLLTVVAFTCRPQALESTGFSCCGSQTLEHRLDDCGAQA